MKCIIVPLDFTEATETVARFAVDIAKGNGAKIVFCYAHNVIYAPSAISQMSAVAATNIPNLVTQQKLMEQQLEEFTQKIEGLSQISFENKVAIGSQEMVVYDLIEEKGADLVIMGTHERTLTEKLFLGTVDDKISRSAACPVLLIPDNHKFASVQNIGLALDDDWTQNVIELDILLNILETYDAKLEVVHISNAAEELEGKERFLKSIRKFMKEVKVHSQVVQHEEVKAGLLRFIQEQSIHMLALVYRDHDFFKRVFNPGVRKEMISEIDVPLLVLK